MLVGRSVFYEVNMKSKPEFFVTLHWGYKPETGRHVFKDGECYTWEEYNKIKKEENKRARITYWVISLIFIVIRLFVWIKFGV